MSEPACYTAIGAPEVWRAGHLGSPSVRVAILDTGIDTREGARQHLRRKVDYGWDLTSSEERRGWLDLDGHGTEMAAIVAAEHLPPEPLRGVAPRVRLLNFRVADKIGQVASEDAIAAAMHLLLGETKRRRRVHVALLAIDTLCNDDAMRSSMLRIAGALGAAGVLLVIAAGDGADPLPDRRLAALDNVLVVGAVDDEDGYDSKPDPEIVHLAAPGERVPAIAMGSPTTAEGSSPAAALVAGAAALAFSARPAAGAAEIAGRIVRTSRPVGSLAGKTASGGLLDLGRLLLAG